MCDVSAVAVIDVELGEAPVDDVIQCEDRIVSQWREVSSDERHQLRERVDEILRPVGLQTRLLVVERANSIALYFICLTLAALMGLRDQWRTGVLRRIVNSLFRFLSGADLTVRVKKFTWPTTDYERSLEFFSSLQGKPAIFEY